jgi:hypothetical protein
MMNNMPSFLFISFQIAKLSILLGMACNGTSKERVHAQKLLSEELRTTYPLLEDDQIHSTAIWLGLGEELVVPFRQFASLEVSFPILDEGLEEIRRMENPVFRHPFQSPAEILTELYVYGHAAMLANPLLRKRSRVAANYYIDHSGTSPQLFMKARESFNMQRHDIDRWFSHKGWVMQLSSSPPKVRGRKNAFPKL